DLVDINDAHLRTFDIVVCILEQAQNDVFNVFADVTRLSKGGCVGDGGRDVENPSQCAREKCFSGTGGTHQKNVALLDLNFRVPLSDVARRTAGGHSFTTGNALVVIVNGDSESLLRLLLPDTIKIELPFDFRWLEQINARRRR